MSEETTEPNGEANAVDDEEPTNRSYSLMPGMMGYDINRQKEDIRRKREASESSLHSGIDTPNGSEQGR